MNTMAISSGEMEASASRKWPEAVIGDVRERERERVKRKRLVRNEEEGGVICVLEFSIIITNGFSVSNNY